MTCTMDTKMTKYETKSIAYFKWSKKKHLWSEFLEKYGVPNLVRVKEGQHGVNDTCIIENDQLLMLHALVPKHSYTAEDSLGRTIAIPVECENKLLVCPMTGTCDAIFVSDITDVIGSAKYFRVLENKRIEDKEIDYFKPESIVEVDYIDAGNSVVKFRDVDEPVPFSCRIEFEALLDYREYTLKDAVREFGLPIKVRFLLSRNDEQRVDDEWCEFKVSSLGKVTISYISKPDLVVAATEIDDDQSLTLPRKTVKCLQISRYYNLQVSVVKRLHKNDSASLKIIHDFNSAFLEKYDLKELNSPEKFQYLVTQDGNFKSQITSAVLEEKVVGKNEKVPKHDNNVQIQLRREKSALKTQLAILRRCTRRSRNDTMCIDRSPGEDIESQTDVYQGAYASGKRRNYTHTLRSARRKHTYELPPKNDRACESNGCSKLSNNDHEFKFVDSDATCENRATIRLQSQASITVPNDSANSKSRDHVDVQSRDYVNMSSQDNFDMTSRDYVDMTSRDYVDMTKRDYVHITSRDYVDMTSRDYVDMTLRDYVDITSRDYVDMTTQKCVGLSLQNEKGQGDYVNCPCVPLPSASPQQINSEQCQNMIKNTVFEHGAQACPDIKQLDSRSKRSAEAIRLEIHKEKLTPSTKDTILLKPSVDVSTETKEFENGKEISSHKNIKIKDCPSNQSKMLILPKDLLSVKLKHVEPAVTLGCKPDNNNFGKTNSFKTVTKFSQNVKKHTKKAPVRIPTHLTLLKSGGKTAEETMHLLTKTENKMISVDSDKLNSKMMASVGECDTTEAGWKKSNNNKTSNATVWLQVPSKVPVKLPVQNCQFSRKPKVPPPVIPRTKTRIARVDSQAVSDAGSLPLNLNNAT